MDESRLSEIAREIELVMRRVEAERAEANERAWKAAQQEGVQPFTWPDRKPRPPKKMRVPHRRRRRRK